MVRLLYTIWALMLNSFKIPIFQTCFANVMEDEFGIPLISSPPITTFLIATSVYVIVVNSTIFPQSFRQPKPIFMCLYEFLVTAFFLEFVIACIWTPIDVLVLSTLPKNICHTLKRLELENAANVLNANKSFMTILTNGIATTILFTTLYVTRAVDFKELTDNGVMYFLSHLRTKLWQRIRSELPEIKTNKENNCRCNNRRKNRSKNRANNQRR
ncbi:uncharacterized protein [Anoplolepis gracilipes]|uniref:uncharacterized protein n=1 Tax=Anoplolepis gracilipes TaxID=354296 RepID=UPI003B9E94E7